MAAGIYGGLIIINTNVVAGHVSLEIYFILFAFLASKPMYCIVNDMVIPLLSLRSDDNALPTQTSFLLLFLR